MTEQSPTREHEPRLLRHRVPDWQDPVVLLTSLAEADYRAVPEEIEGHRYITITCPTGAKATGSGSMT